MIASKQNVIDAITAEFLAYDPSLPDWGKNSKFSLMTQRNPMPNPAPRAMVPAPLDPVALMALVPDDEYRKMDGEFRATVLNAIESGDVTRLSLIAASGVKLQFLSPDTVSRLQAELTKTVPDPNWHSEVPGTSFWQDLVAGQGWTQIAFQDNLRYRDSNGNWQTKTVAVVVDDLTNPPMQIIQEMQG